LILVYEKQVVLDTCIQRHLKDAMRAKYFALAGTMRHATKVCCNWWKQSAHRYSSPCLHQNNLTWSVRQLSLVKNNLTLVN